MAGQITRYVNEIASKNGRLVLVAAVVMCCFTGAGHMDKVDKVEVKLGASLAAQVLTLILTRILTLTLTITLTLTLTLTLTVTLTLNPKP